MTDLDDEWIEADGRTFKPEQIMAEKDKRIRELEDFIRSGLCPQDADCPACVEARVLLGDMEALGDG